MKRILIAVMALTFIVLSFAACSGNGDDGENNSTSAVISYLNADGALVSKTVSEQTGNTLDVQIKDGHAFLGYFTAEGMQYFDENGKQLDSILVDRNLELTPKFKAYEYTVILDAQVGLFDDGTSKKEITVSYGEDISQKIPSVKGSSDKFELDGWFSEDGSVRLSNGEQLINPLLTGEFYSLGVGGGTLTFVAKYKVKELTVILDYNDGVTLPAEIKVPYGEGFGDLSGYTIDNGEQYIRTWSTTPYGEMELPDFIVVDTRIYAIWQSYKTVSFVYSSSVTKEHKVDVTAGQSSILPQNPILPGYKFEGWYENATLSGNPVTAVPYGALKDCYYGKWQETDYELSFVTQISEALEPIRYSYGDTFELPTLTRTGYVFEGWSSGKDGETPFTSIPNTLFGDLALVAVWTPVKVNVILDVDGGRLDYYDIDIAYESLYEIGIPEKEGYSFKGWYSGSEAMTDENGKALLIWNSLENGTFTAKWEVNIYSVSYVTGTDEKIDNQSYQHGEKIQLPTGLKNGALLLEGWYLDEAFEKRVSRNTLVKSDMTFYASWQEMIAITDAEGLLAVAEHPDYVYYLANDINLNGKNWTPIPELFGAIDGKGHKIYNFALSCTENVSGYGLFIKNSGTIRDVVIEDFTCNISVVAVSPSIGILVGENSGLISGCTVTGGSAKVSVSTPSGNQGSPTYSPKFAALVGNNSGTVDDCVVQKTDMTITGIANRPYNSNILIYNCYNGVVSYVGGVVGYSTGKISYCKSYVTIVANGYGYGYSDARTGTYSLLGGIVGEVSKDGTIEKCYSEASLTTTSNIGAASAYTYSYVGGIIGILHGKANMCVSGGEIKSSANAETCSGGIAGKNTGEIVDCYSGATVSGGHQGGIVGLNESTVRSCFAYASLKGGGGICGTNTSTGTVTKSVFIGSVAVGESIAYTIIGSNSGTVSKIYSLDDYDKEKLIGYDFLVGELYWDESVWSVDKGGFYLPMLNWENE